MILNRIYGWARTHPDRTALIHNGVSVSYAEFACSVGVVRSFFQQLDLPRGKTVVIIAEDLFRAWQMILAARSLGLNTICAQDIKSAQDLNIKDVCCVALPVEERPQHRLEGDVCYAPAYDGAGRDADRRPISDLEPGEAGAHILYTTGTTGANKKVMFWERQDILHADRMHGARGGLDGVLHAKSLRLWQSNSRTPLGYWYYGGCVIYEQRENKYARLADHKFDRTSFTPSSVALAIKAFAPREAVFGDAAVEVGGGFLTTQLLQDARRVLSRNIGITYGSTECRSIMYSRCVNEDDLYWLTPRPGRVVEVVDASGAQCADDEQGELRVLLLEEDADAYLDDEEASRKVFRDGCFYPGDLAVRRADGRVRILGRVADVLNFQGDKVAVGPLELDLQAFLGVENVCLFSGLDSEGRDELVVAVETDGAVSEAAREEIRRAYRSFDRVRVEVLPAFPRTDSEMAKISRTALREMLSAPKR